MRESGLKRHMRDKTIGWLDLVNKQKVKFGVNMYLFMREVQLMSFLAFIFLKKVDWNWKIYFVV